MSTNSDESALDAEKDLADARRAERTLSAGQATLIEQLEAYERLRKAFARLDANMTAGIGAPPRDWCSNWKQELMEDRSKVVVGGDVADAPDLRARLLSESRAQLLTDLVNALRARVSSVAHEQTICFDQFLDVSWSGPGRTLMVELLGAAEMLLPAPSIATAVMDGIIGKRRLTTALQGTVVAMGFSDGWVRRSGGSRSSCAVCWLDIEPIVKGKDDEEAISIYVPKEEGSTFRVGQRVEIQIVLRDE